METRRPVLLFVAKRGMYFEHLRNVVRLGTPEAECHLMRAGMPGIPRLAGSAAPLQAMLPTHLARRRQRRPWLFGRVVHPFYRHGLEFYSRWLYRSWLFRLRQLCPDAVVMWNGYRMPETAVKAAARTLRIPVIHVELGCLPFTRNIDPVGINAASSIPRDPDYYRKRAANAAAMSSTAAGDGNWSLAVRDPKPYRETEFSRALSILPSRFAFLPFQVESDSQIVEHSPRISGMVELFEWVEEALASPLLADLHVVIKEHPTSPFRYPELHERAAHHPRIHFANGNVTQELIEAAETVITVNSTAGLEALLFGKRVITLGEAFYNIRGLLQMAVTPEELAKYLADGEWQSDAGIRQGLVDYLQQVYCVPMAGKGQLDDDWKAVAKRIVELCIDPTLIAPDPESSMLPGQLPDTRRAPDPQA